MISTLSVLDRSGDLTLTWDHSDEAARENARQEVERLWKAGYSFFLANGSPVDAVAAGAGTLIVRRLDAAEVVAETPPDEPSEPAEAPVDPPSKRRGRPPKADRHVVAVRPLSGG
jgi:hypothetical protein